MNPANLTYPEVDWPAKAEVHPTSQCMVKEPEKCTFPTDPHKMYTSAAKMAKVANSKMQNAPLVGSEGNLPMFEMHPHTPFHSNQPTVKRNVSFESESNGSCRMWMFILRTQNIL